MLESFKYKETNKTQAKKKLKSKITNYRNAIIRFWLKMTIYAKLEGWVIEDEMEGFRIVRDLWNLRCKWTKLRRMRMHTIKTTINFSGFTLTMRKSWRKMKSRGSKRKKSRWVVNQVGIEMAIYMWGGPATSLQSLLLRFFSCSGFSFFFLKKNKYLVIFFSIIRIVSYNISSELLNFITCKIIKIFS